MVAHHASCVIDDATTTVHNNTHRKYSKHFCGGGGGENCNRITSSSPKTTTNLKSRSCKHSRSTSTSPLKRCSNMLQPTITTNTVSIFEDEDIPHYHSWSHLCPIKEDIAFLFSSADFNVYAYHQLAWSLESWRKILASVISKRWLLNTVEATSQKLCFAFGIFITFTNHKAHVRIFTRI